MSQCSVCKKSLSAIIMNNRWVCFKCDELLFDLEIENDETEIQRPAPLSTSIKTDNTLTLKPSGQK